MNQGRDRRAHPRVSVSVELDFECQHNLYVGRTRDLSLGGLFIETDVEIPVGTQIDVRLTMFKKAFSLRCEVAWALFEGDRCTGFGVRFLHLPAQTAKTLQAFMALRQPISYESDVELIADQAC